MNPLTIAQSIFAILLVILILLQQRGTALGGAFGGSGEFYGTKRGAERVIFRATIVVAALFLGTALAQILFLR